MASNLEFVNYKQFVESLPARTTAKSGDKTVVSNSTDGPGVEVGNSAIVKNILDNFFEEFSTEKAYDYGDKVRNKGEFYFFRAHKNAGAWNSAYVWKFNFAQLVLDLQQILNEKSAYWGADFSSTFTSHKGVTTNGDVGSVVDLTPVTISGCSCSVVDCAPGDVFRLYGNGYSAYRLYCFIDSSNKIISSCFPSAIIPSSDPLVVVAPEGAGKVIFNMQITARYAAKCEGINNIVNSIVSSINSEIDFTKLSLYEKSSYYGNSIASSRTTGKGYVTNTGVGSTVDMTGASQAGINSFVIPCVKGDVFKIMGVGYSTYRMWCFVDSNNKIVEVADASITTNGAFIYKEAPVDGKAIIQFNTQSSSYVWDLYVRSSVDDGFKGVDDFEDSVYEKSSVYGESLLSSANFHKSITTDGGVGSTVDYTEVSISGCVYSVQTCKKGDVFKLRGIGYSSARLWCFVDSSDKVVDYAYNAYLNNTGADFVYLTAPVDGKIIVNLAIDANRYFAKRESVQSRFEADEGRVEFIEQSAPMVNLELDKEPFDPTSLLSDFDFSDNSNYTSNLYALFDALLAASDGVITKFDVGEFCDEEYPAYCGDEKIYCYKISKTYDGWGNSGKFKKRNLLITGGVHGNEKAAPFNLYIMAWRLINDPAHSDIFSLFDAFDIYIIPCVNLYGLKNNTRWNGNGVDINRNSDTVGWVVSGEPYQSTYTGPYADSEFETRCVHKCCEDLAVDWYVDHHNYALAQEQFYTQVNDKRIFLRSYEALKEVSLFCIKNFPTYFGTKFQLLRSAQYPSAVPEGLNATIGDLQKWAFENGFLSTTIEISQTINYDGGAVDLSIWRDSFGADTFCVGEFTLRCQLILYGQILMPQVY